MIEKQLGKKDFSFTSLESFIAAKVTVEAMRRAGPNMTRESFQKALDGMKGYDAGGYIVNFADRTTTAACSSSHRARPRQEVQLLKKEGVMKRINLLAVLILGCRSARPPRRINACWARAWTAGSANCRRAIPRPKANRPDWVRGESLDSGLGELPPTYTASEYMYAGWVRGESLDSGLGEQAADL